MHKSYSKDLFLLAILLVVTFGVLLGTRPLNTPDEGRYAEVAREMLVSHNYITPQVNHVVFLDKPPLVYWLTAASLHTFGVNIWAARMIPALFALLGCLMAYITARKLYDRRAGWLAATMLASSLLYFAMGHYVNMDMAIAVLVSITLQCFILAMNDEKHRRKYLYAAYIVSALAILTKGLIGLVFPLMIIGAWIIYCKQWSQIKKMCLPTGLLLIAAIAIPWFFGVQKSNSEFLHYFFIYEQFTRFTGNEFNNPQPIWYYLPVVLLGFYPWSSFAIPALKTAWPKWSARVAQKNEVFLFLWLGLIFIFFSIPQAKITSYILPIFPALAILTAGQLSQRWDNIKTWHWPLRINLFINILLALALITIANKTINGVDFWQAKKLIYLMAGLLIVGMALVYMRKQAFWRFTLMAVTLIVFSWLALMLVPAVLKDSTQALTAKLIPLLKANDKVISYQMYYQDLPFYLQRKIMVVANWQDSGLKYEDNSLGQLAWDKQYQPQSKQWLINTKQFWQLWHSRQQIYVIMDRDSVAGFKQQAESPVYQLAQVKYTRLFSNHKPT